MTIDEALNLLNNSKPKSNNALSIQMNEAINVIGVTIHKYQKIEQIFKEPCIIPEGCYSMLKKIERVVKDEDKND